MATKPVPPTATPAPQATRPLSKLAQKVVQRMQADFQRELNEVIAADAEAQGLTSGQWTFSLERMEWDAKPAPETPTP